MSTENSKPSETEPRGTPAGGNPASAPDNGEAGPEKPPESAEDFEHVLRRLIAGRDRQS